MSLYHGVRDLIFNNIFIIFFDFMRYNRCFMSCLSWSCLFLNMYHSRFIFIFIYWSTLLRMHKVLINIKIHFKGSKARFDVDKDRKSILLVPFYTSIKFEVVLEVVFSGKIFTRIITKVDPWILEFRTFFASVLSRYWRPLHTTTIYHTTPFFGAMLFSLLNRGLYQWN